MGSSLGDALNSKGSLLVATTVLSATRKKASWCPASMIIAKCMPSGEIFTSETETR
jgi:hypothetical protein